MIINRKTKIIGKNVILIPYRKEHVTKYHEWMKCKNLQELTGSEPLSLEEEFRMQKSWLIDANKCTFIVLDRVKLEDTGDEIASMIGDTNLFFLSSDVHVVGEAEIMIAESWARGRHCGWEAMLLMLSYGAKYLDVKIYTVKIKTFNEISVNMFKNMGFMEICRSEVFNEVTMDKVVDDMWMKWLDTSLGQYKIVEYEKIAD